MKGLSTAVAAVCVVATPAQARPLRVMALDQCADQYVLHLAPEADLAVSPRADDPDAWAREAAAGRRRLRPTLEAATAFDPDVVVRYWGGDQRLLGRLKGAGVRVVELRDATDFAGIEANVAAVADAVGEPERGRAEIARMRARLADGPAPASRGDALYLTPGGFTAGSGTLISAMLQAAGFSTPAGVTGYAPVSVERIALTPPARFVLGFFDQRRGDRRGPGRHPVVRRAAAGRTIASLPAATLTCPAWFAVDGVAALRAAA